MKEEITSFNQSQSLKLQKKKD